MASIPHDPAFDGTRAFFREGYDYVGNRCRALGSDLFRARIGLRPTVFMAGEEAARRFYDGESFTRVGAIPPTTLRLLQDVGSVQSLDGEAHRRRKALHMAISAGEGAERMGELFEERWRAAAPGWRRDGRVVLHDAAVLMLCDAACAWVGAPISGRALGRRAAETAAMVDGAGSAGPRAWRALLLRRRTERWARRVIADARRGAPTGSPASRIAHHRDGRGDLLDLRTAAVELVNLVRPTVAVARYVAFAALALHEHREAAAWLSEDPDARAAAFAEEVRRYYPFFPVVGGRVRRAFKWRDHAFRPGDRVMLGLHATDRDPQLWPEPERFRPERFAGWTSSGFDLIPQGAGDHRRDHRCPGEEVTVGIMRRAVRLLLQLDYEVPPQDLGVRLDRFPTLPADGMVLRVRRGPEGGDASEKTPNLRHLPAGGGVEAPIGSTPAMRDRVMTEAARKRTAAFALAAAGAAVAAAVTVRARRSGRLREEARFPHQATGVAVAADGRRFVNFPRWTDDAPISVAEIMPDGGLRPYPDARWNAWRNAKATELPVADHFVCVQSVVPDGRGRLWVLDPGAPGNERILEGAPKLVAIDLATDRVVKVIAVPGDVALQGTYLNDIRFSPDGRTGYVTDSGARGAIIVIDLETGAGFRALDGHPSTQPEGDVTVTIDGAPLRRPDGRQPFFAADGIAISGDGRTLYWQALTGRTLYSIDTDLLRPEVDEAARAGGVRTVATTCVADGLWMSRAGVLYVTSPTDFSIKRLRGDRLETVLTDRRLRWPDTFAEGPDGRMYVTASRIQDTSWFKSTAPASLPTKLFSFDPAA